MRDNERQALRIRRFLIGSATSLLVILALFVFAELDALPTAAAVQGSAGILALIALFYAAFRSGLNLRRADPSLTAEMIGAAILLLAYVMYHAGAARNALSFFYMTALLFGVLRLDTRKLLALAALALAAHAGMLALSYASEPEMDLKAAALQFTVLIIVLPWFAVMGGYVNSLRRRLSDSNRQLKDAYDRIEQIAIHDELTGLYNRRFLMEALTREQSRAKRTKAEFAVCLFDIDHFKSINDTLGHAAGDAVLKHFALVSSAGLRGVDMLGRYGGEEFLLILPGTGQAGACAAGERVRARIEAAGFPQLPADRRVTVTVGVAASRPGEDSHALIGRADGALYEGKTAGRNRVVAVG
ncbi:MAG TPA: GGDEF domain-containing protein [Burkholderiales bacterium]|nr:GGDEF domain-containing protein [Burkholderiales bacterium]